MLRLEDLAELVDRYPHEAQTQVRGFAVRGRHFAFNDAPVVMGVINLSNASWYRESVCLSLQQAIQRAHVLHAQGADWIDLGAESTVLQAERVRPENQTKVLLPLIKQLAADGIIVSAETYHPKVARACLEAGAAILNFTGREHNEEIFRISADHDAAVILCYVEGANVREVRDFNLASDPLSRTREYFSQQIEVAKRCGCEKLVLDPGLGFYYENLQDSARRVRHQMTTFLNTFRLRALGLPVCQALPHAFEFFGEEVRCAEPFFAVLAALGKTDVFRTHEVPRIKAVLSVLQAY